MIASPGAPDQAWPPPRTARRVMGLLRNLSQLGPARFGRGTGFRRPMAERDQKNAPPRRGRGSEAKRLSPPRRSRDLDRHPGLGRFGNGVGVLGLAKEQDADHEGHHRHDDRVPEPVGDVAGIGHEAQDRNGRQRSTAGDRAQSIGRACSGACKLRGDAAVFPRPTRRMRSLGLIPNEQQHRLRLFNREAIGWRPVRDREAPHVTCLAML